MKCQKCQELISKKRLLLIPETRFCFECQTEEDVFKYKMKTVGFNDTPTIAKNQKDWNILSKQKQSRDI